jgi:signal transduction histidine kinase
VSQEPRSPDDEVLVALNRAATTARLMSGAVHEINNALQVIAGSVELLEQQPALSPPVLKSLDRIKRQTERAAGAVGDLQMFTKAPLDGRERFSLRDVVSHAVSLRRYAVARLGLTLEYKPDEHVNTLVTGNAGLVQQAVLNLLVNAEQAMAGSQGAIVVVIRNSADRAGVQVSDSGPGLGAVAEGELFRPFASTRPPRDGAGLGLWAARTIAQSFGGSVEVASTESGVSVMMWLPRAETTAVGRGGATGAPTSA